MGFWEMAKVLCRLVRVSLLGIGLAAVILLPIHSNVFSEVLWCLCHDFINMMVV